MTQSTTDYLSSLDLPDFVFLRVNEISEAFRFLCRSTIDRLFVSDSRDITTNERVYESLWGFSGPYWMEARNFLKQSDVDIASYLGSIHYLGVQYEAVVLPDGVNESSRMSIEVGTTKVEYSMLSATGHNCTALISILDTLLIPSLVPSRDSDSGPNIAGD